MYKLSLDSSSVAEFLLEKNWLFPQEAVKSTEVPGAGNMNFTIRVITNQRSFILKQSRPYVEKYPQVPAPADRVLREGEFYKLTAHIPALAARTPKLLGIDEEQSILQLEDLGVGSDFTGMYAGKKNLTIEEVTELVDFAVSLHDSFQDLPSEKRITNREMRKLNHEHIFHYPFVEENGMNLDKVLPGLEKSAAVYRQDAMLKQRVEGLGELYLADGPCLLHGDYFPGSWLQTPQGIRIIDPEFCFFGSREFELGVMLGHLQLSAQPKEIQDYALAYYLQKSGVDQVLVKKFAAVEVLRRLIGLAQLPLSLNIQERISLMQKASLTLTS
ncbi:MAG: phosphotransferase [Algoriphagus sp.]|nr:phosphotransferase [Algoriphagus sp.]